MGMIKQNCPNCRAHYNEKCNAWVYGSPIRKCPKCGSEFLDKRWREVALEGFQAGKVSWKFYLVGTVGFLIFSILCGLWLLSLINTQGSYPTRLLGCIMIGLFGSAGCFVMFIRCVTGYEDKKNAMYLEESKRRMQNPEYVEKLRAYGYDIPE